MLVRWAKNCYRIKLSLSMWPGELALSVMFVAVSCPRLTLVEILDDPPRGLLFGLSESDAKAAVSTNCRAALLHGGEQVLPITALNGHIRSQSLISDS